MGKTMLFGEDLRVQHRLREYPPVNSLDIPENGRGAKSNKVKVLRLVATPAEGCKLLGKLRNDPLTNGVPIIILTR